MLQAQWGSPAAALPQCRAGSGSLLRGCGTGAKPWGHGVTQFLPARARSWAWCWDSSSPRGCSTDLTALPVLGLGHPLAMGTGMALGWQGCSSGCSSRASQDVAQSIPCAGVVPRVGDPSVCSQVASGDASTGRWCWALLSLCSPGSQPCVTGQAVVWDVLVQWALCHCLPPPCAVSATRTHWPSLPRWRQA